MPKNRVSVAAFFCAALAVQVALAANDDPTKPDYSKESFIISDLQTHLHFRADGASVRTQTTSIKLLSEAGVRFWGVLAFPYAAENERIDIHFVRVHKADGSVVATPAENVLDLPSDVTRVAPMYSDLKQKQVPVKALGVGDTLEFEVAFIEDKPLVPGQFWFSYNFTRNAVVLKEVLEVRVPRDKQPRIANADQKPVIADDGSERVYTWTVSHTDPTKPAGAEKNTAKDEKVSVQLSTFASWREVGEWYRGLAQPQAKVTPEIQAKADSLVKGIPAGPAQAQAIYDFVSSHIRYIGLSFGIGRYQPHSAETVLENGYGDCKDKHTLLAALLRAEGVEAWPVLISTSQKLDEDVPSPGQFDHLITVIPHGKQYEWLDATPEVAPYGMLLNILRDKQALVVSASVAPFLTKTPADLPFPSEDSFVMRGELNNEGTFKGHGEIALRGDSEVVFRSVFHSNAKAQWQDLMQTISQNLGFGGEVSNVVVADPDETREPFHISYDYLRKRYGDWDNRLIGPPTPGLPIMLVDEDKKPPGPIQAGSTGTTIYKAEITLPPGDTMEPPAGIDLKNSFAEYHAKYSVAGGKFLAERRLILFKSEVAVEDWQKYVAFQKEIHDDFVKMSSLTAPTVEPAAKSADAKSDQEAADLIAKAAQDLQEYAFQAAEDALEKAKKINPHQTNLNAMFGSLYLIQGKTEEGIAAFREELRDHPENIANARQFAQMLSRIKRDDDAIEVYRGVLNSAPDDVDSITELSWLLVRKQRWKEAQPVLEKAIRLRPDNAQIELWYGQSSLQTGKEAEGIAALKSAANATDDPALLSTITLALADAGKSLDVAEDAARRAVSISEEQSGKFSLENVTDLQVKKMIELAMVWDRRSWVAFKAGDFAVAEKYALAAWTLAQEPGAGDHLGQIYEQEGKTAQALDAFKLAKARGYPPVEGIDDRIAALEKRAGHSSSIQDNLSDRLQKMRTIRVARIKPLSASADFLVLIAGGKVNEVKMIGGDPSLVVYADRLKQAKFNVIFPDEGPEHIIRQGILSCSPYDPNCMFLMMLPTDASSRSRMDIPLHTR
jgi:tetratricopeptide (TPR) repeat protein